MLVVEARENVSRIEALAELNPVKEPNVEAEVVSEDKALLRFGPLALLDEQIVDRLSETELPADLDPLRALMLS